jgi:hypothetical protein
MLRRSHAADRIFPSGLNSRLKIPPTNLRNIKYSTGIGSALRFSNTKHTGTVDLNGGEREIFKKLKNNVLEP